MMRLLRVLCCQRIAGKGGCLDAEGHSFVCLPKSASFYFVATHAVVDVFLRAFQRIVGLVTALVSISRGGYSALSFDATKAALAASLVTFIDVNYKLMVQSPPTNEAHVRIPQR